jgi:CheY-like chemotaxis protein
LSEKEKTILIVDDELEISELFSEMLTISGFQVRSSHHYNQAIDSINTAPPDGIVLDVMMPEKSGLEVLHFVRTHPDYRDIPVIIVSSKGFPEDVEAYQNAGANQYLRKPVSFPDFTQAVQKALQTK